MLRNFFSIYINLSFFFVVNKINENRISKFTVEVYV